MTCVISKEPTKLDLVSSDHVRRSSMETPSPPAAPVRCRCGFLIFDGEVLRSRAVLLAEGVAKCRCKRWVEVPVTLTG